MKNKSPILPEEPFTLYTAYLLHNALITGFDIERRQMEYLEDSASYARLLNLEKKYQALFQV